MSQPVGQPLSRVDGVAKVTGAARYAADNLPLSTAYGALALSTIARGTITSIDTSAARAATGVVAVFTHLNAPRIAVPPWGAGFVPMQDPAIHHNGQLIAFVVAETLEQAQYAATLVDVSYGSQQPKALLADHLDEAYLPSGQEFVRGDPAAGLAAADVTITADYTSPAHHHNPIEPHATVAVWSGERVTVYESTQGVGSAGSSLARALGVPTGNAHVVAPYLGGGFGSKTAIGTHSLFNAAIARVVGRPLKLVLTRAQMFSITGHRAEFRQRVTLGARRDGTLTALVHTSTQQLTELVETVFNGSDSSRRLYGCPNIHTRQEGVRLDVPASSYMRSPEMSGHFGLETALDELSHELSLDPIALRIKNYTDIDPESGLRYTSKYLREAYQLGADAFGWSRRNPKPGSTRDGGEYVGWGMATEAHAYDTGPASALVRANTDGTVLVQSGTQDIGTGTYTVLTQVAAQALGIGTADVTVQVGDSTFPPAPTSASSATVASVTGAVDKAARAVRDAVVAIAVADPASPLHGLPADQIVTEQGYLKAGSRSESYRAVLARHGVPVENTATASNVPGYTTGAVFVEVRVDPRYGRVRVTRVVGAYDVGRVLNRQTARSQVIGGATWGIGHALLEHTVRDRRTARVVNPSLSSYLVAVNADVPDIQAYFVDKPDPVSTALGARGFGECPITGVPAAIGNAVFHATGRRIRDLPITQDKLL